MFIFGGRAWWPAMVLGALSVTLPSGSASDISLPQLGGQTNAAPIAAVPASGTILNTLPENPSGPSSTLVVASLAAKNSSGAFKTHWIIVASALNELASAGGTAAAKAISGDPTTVILGNPASLGIYAAMSGASAKSLSAIRTALSSTPKVSTVLYDVEDWSYTPLAEQLEPIAATQTAQSITSAADTPLIAAPALDLMKVLYPGIPPRVAYISKNVAGRIAQYASAIDIQAQSIETNPSEYANFVLAAAAEARAANPHVRVYAGISTNPDGQTVTATELYQDVNSTAGSVYGYWLNIPSGGTYCPSCGTPQPHIAVQLLATLGVG